MSNTFITPREGTLTLLRVGLICFRVWVERDDLRDVVEMPRVDETVVVMELTFDVLDAELDMDDRANAEELGEVVAV